MKADFWHQMWASGVVGFHRDEVNGFLKTFWPDFQLAEKEAVLVPLCGKSLDMLWLKEQGQDVLGVELSARALDAFLVENDLTATPVKHERFCGYELADMTLLCGDFFHLSSEDCQEIKAVYDRAALVALPVEMRATYAAHLAEILRSGVQMLVITMVYDSPELQGPPFSVCEEEVERLYRDNFEIVKLTTHDIVRKGQPVVEIVYRMVKK